MLHVSLRMDFFGMTDVGLVRKTNEDAWGAEPDCRFFVLADGMGGHNAGEVAAMEVVNRLKNLIKSLDDEGKKNHLSPSKMAIKLKETIQEVNSEIYKLSLEQEAFQGMGTTLCCLYCYQEHMIISHVGDSRIYKLNKDEGDLEQLTIDHSLVNELISLGQLSQDEAVDFPFKNVLTKSIGNNPFTEVSCKIYPIKTGDYYIMCSDGLTNFAPISSIKKKILDGALNNDNLQETTKNLIELAKQHGGGDNITVVIVKFDK